MNKKVLFALSLLSIMVFLSACGGGGNGGSLSSPNTNPGVPSVIRLLDVQSIVQTDATLFLKAMVLDGNGKPVPNVPVFFTNISAPLGVLGATVANTDANGIATVTLNSSVAGFVTIAVEVSTAAGQIRNQTTVYFTPFDMTLATADLSSLTLDVDSNNNGIFDEPSDFILFNPPGKTDALIRATVTDSSGAPLLNSAVTFGADSPDVSFPEGSSKTAPVVHTNAAGQASILARVSPSILTTSVTTVNITASAVISPFLTLANIITLQLYPVTINSVTVAADPSTVASAGTSSISAIVLTSAGTPAPSGTMVNFTTSGGSVTPFAATDATGLAKATLTAPTVTSNTTVTVTASTGGKSGSTSVAVTAVPSALTIVPASVSISGVTGGTATFTITGGTPSYTTTSSNPIIACNDVNANGSCSDAGDKGTWTGSSVKVTVPAGTPAGSVTINVFDSLGATKSATITITSLPSPALTIVPASVSISSASGGTATFTITGGTVPYTTTSSDLTKACNDAAPANGLCTDAGDTGTWTGSSIIVTVPIGAAVGSVTINVFDFLGATKSATITIVP